MKSKVAIATACRDGANRPRLGYNGGMPTPKETRAAAAKAKADDIRARKLHVIAERRAKAAKMDKADYIAEIVKGKYPPITAEDIAEEPTPE